jgi:Reverse transcriptase (RNA-dependent DNA polymerase)
VVSPLLANIYMRRFIVGWKVLGHERRLDAHIVNYADDFVICCRGSADEAMAVMRSMMSKLKLTVNETKTRRCRVPEETFDFLGYTIGRCWSPKTGKAYGLHRDEAVGEEDRSHQAGDQRPDESEMVLDGRRRQSGMAEPDASGLVELLLPWPRQHHVSSR